MTAAYKRLSRRVSLYNFPLEAVFCTRFRKIYYVYNYLNANKSFFIA